MKTIVLEGQLSFEDIDESFSANDVVRLHLAAKGTEFVEEWRRLLEEMEYRNAMIQYLILQLEEKP